MGQSSSRHVGVHYAVSSHRDDEAWELTEETMPESVPHDETAELLKGLLARWAKTTPARSAFVARNLAVRWDEERPKVGVDPDVCVLSPAPPQVHDLTSVRTWLPGHAPPVLAVEVVSASSPHKDYRIAPDKYAASGTRELWIFDPMLAGPSTHGGPHRLQVWSRRSDETFVRIYAGEGPAFSPIIEAWLVVVDEGRRLRIAADAEATRFWRTGEESEREAKELERAEKERALAEKDQAVAERDQVLARVAELEAQLKKRG